MNMEKVTVLAAALGTVATAIYAGLTGDIWFWWSSGAFFGVGLSMLEWINKSKDRRDAERYRYLRQTWNYNTDKRRLEWPRLEWYLPHSFEKTDFGKRLDDSIDSSMRIRGE